ncbi:MAG: sigma-70 family RNA polymerase sigma factor, partial [Anaerolineales bacterium]
MPAFDQQAESQWIRLAQAGDDQAFSELVGAFQVPVFNLCYRMLGERNEAEDAAQETFFRAYRNIKKYDAERKFVTWVLSIASNHCIDRLRKRRMIFLSLDETPEIWEGSDPNPGPEHTIEDQELQIEVQNMLGKLNYSDRAAILLRYWYDYSYEEIADTLTLSVSAVKSRLHRARRDL